MPGFGAVDVAQDLIDKVHQEGPASLDTLKQVVLDPNSHPERRYCAMGFLVALHNNYESPTADDMVSVLNEVIRSSESKRFDQTREDALGALLRLYRRKGSDNPGIMRLIAIANDPQSHENLRRNALLVLTRAAAAANNAVTETLARGVLELRDGMDRFRLADAIGQAWSETWGAKATLFVNLLADSSKDRSELDSGAVLHALRPQDEPWTRRIGPLADFFIHSAEGANERMSGNLAELLVECFGRNPDQAGTRSTCTSGTTTFPSPH
jgi:hypothetical protein